MSAIHDWNRSGCTDNTLQTLFGYSDWLGTKFWIGGPNYLDIRPPANSTFAVNETSGVQIQTSAIGNSTLNLNISGSDTLRPNLNISDTQANVNGPLKPGPQCNPLENSCTITPCDPQDLNCRFEKGTDFSNGGSPGPFEDYGMRIGEPHDQSFEDIKAVHRANLVDFNNKIQSLPIEAFNSTANVTDLKQSFEINIVTGNDSLVKLVDDNNFNKVVLRLEEIKDSLPEFFMNPYLSLITNNTQFLILGITNMSPNDEQECRGLARLANSCLFTASQRRANHSAEATDYMTRSNIQPTGIH